MHYNFDKIRLRWRFDFLSRLTRYGQWSRPADRSEDMAAFQNGEGLVRASIEAQDVVTNEIVTVAECDGYDFRNFQWISAAFGFSGSNVKIVGLSLWTREERCNVYVDGTTQFETLSEDDKKYHFATYGK